MPAGAETVILPDLERSTSEVEIGVTPRDILRVRLIELHGSAGLSWRKIAALPEFAPLPPGTLCSWAKTGHLPRKWFARFGLVAYLPAPACPVHGVVHCYDCETQAVKPLSKPQAKPRPPRISIRQDDPDSAARSILAHMEVGVVAELRKLLDS